MLTRTPPSPTRRSIRYSTAIGSRPLPIPHLNTCCPTSTSPTAITPGNVDYPGSPLTPEPAPLPPALGGGWRRRRRRIDAHSGDELASSLGHLVGPVELSNFGIGGDFSHLGISSAPLLSLGGIGMPLVQTVDGLAGGVLHDAAGITNGLLAPLSAVPILGPLAAGPLISPLLGEVATSLGESASGGDSAHAAHAAVGSAAPTTFTDAVTSSVTPDLASPGTITFAGAPFSADLPQMFANGSFTDFGVTVQSTLADPHSITGIIDHLDAGVAQLDLGHVLDLQNIGSIVHLNDDGHLRTPLDLG